MCIRVKEETTASGPALWGYSCRCALLFPATWHAYKINEEKLIARVCGDAQCLVFSMRTWVYGEDPHKKLIWLPGSVMGGKTGRFQELADYKLGQQQALSSAVRPSLKNKWRIIREDIHPHIKDECVWSSIYSYIWYIYIYMYIYHIHNKKYNYIPTICTNVQKYVPSRSICIWWTQL